MNAEEDIDFLKGAEDFYRGKEVLVPGGAGFIGSRLADRLCRLGAAVTVVDPLDPSCGGSSFNLRSCRGRVRLVRQRIESFLRKEGPAPFSLIFNCAGLADHHLGLSCPDLDYRINCLGGLALLQKMARDRTGARIVSIGSRSQYGRGDSGLRESDPLRPLDMQAAHKTALEHYHRIFAGAFGLDFVFLRLTNTYGPGQRMRGKGIGLVGEMVRDSLDRGEVVIYGSPDRVKDLLYVDDAVEALLAAGRAAQCPDPVFNVGGRPCRVGELVDSVRRHLPGVRVEIREFPEAVRRLDTGDAVLNSEKFRAATAWSPRVSVDEGISRTVPFYLEYRRRYW